jgi:predicted anti-sigma-YlaC factor YlaD
VAGNFVAGPRDNVIVDCETCREMLSARLDGEAEPVPAAWTDRHLAGCAACGRWQEQVGGLTRALRVHAVVETPDLTKRVLDAAPAPARADLWWRFALGVIAAVQIWIGVAPIFGIDLGMPKPMAMPGDMNAHLFDESTAWNLALGLGMAFVALRVRAAAGMLAVLGGFLVVLTAFCVHDLLVGDVTVMRVASHGLLAIGFGLVWKVYRLSGRERGPVPGTPAAAGRDDYPELTASPDGRPPALADTSDGPGRRRWLRPANHRRVA